MCLDHAPPATRSWQVPAPRLSMSARRPVRPARVVAFAIALLASFSGVAADDMAARRAAFDARPPEQRDAIAVRARDWDAATPAQRAARREAQAAWTALPATERDALQRAAARFATLPADEQASLRARWDALDDYERRGWALGPTLGAAWPKLHALLAQVPEDQRAALLPMLQSLPPQAIADLSVLAQRTPPQDRDALRRALLATPAPARADWLRRRVGG